MAAYKTIAAPAEAEIVEKKSRFIGQIAPVSTEEEALAFIAEVKPPCVLSTAAMMTMMPMSMMIPWMKSLMAVAIYPPAMT